jgi:hypothetical protein
MELRLQVSIRVRGGESAELFDSPMTINPNVSIRVRGGESAERLPSITVANLHVF